MTILVIGASGFIGRSIVGRLLATGERVIAASRTARNCPVAANLVSSTLELSTFDNWPSLLSNVSTVYHLAWSTVPASASADPVKDVTTNVVGSLRLIDALRKRPNTRLVFASSGGTVYGRLSKVPVSEVDPANPIGAYGISKLAVEHYIRHYVDSHGVDAVVLRIGNAYGEGQLSQPDFGAVSTFCLRAVANEPVAIFGDGTVVRDYIHVDDVVDALLLVARTRSDYRTFNIGSGRGRSLNDIVTTIEQLLGRKLVIQYRPARPFDVPVSVLDATRAKTELDWKQRIPFEEGVTRVLTAVGRKGRVQ